VKITHLSTYDLSGGAARAAYRLHAGLRLLGHESGMLTLYKTSCDPSVVRFDPPQDILTRFRRGFKRRMLERDGSVLIARPAGSTFFSDDRSQHGADALRQLPATDILNLHWIASFIDYRLFFRKVPKGLQVVWTLHDMNPFTGGCHYDEACGKFQQKCGACPQLESSDLKDFSSRVWRRKREAFSSRGAQRLHVVTPSRWLANEAGRSALLAEREITVIPNGLDLEDFQPRDRQTARAKYGIPPEAKAVLFVAESAAERRKGLKTLLEALRGLENTENLLFVAIGGGMTEKGSAGRFKTVDFVGDEAALSFLYSAADLFVVPSLQDNLPNTAVEALACGVPTIGSNVGGLPEIVRDGKTGFLVPPEDSHALGKAINTVLRNPELPALMARESRRVALQEYDVRLQAKRYAELYRRALESAGSR
jgi:glycosyltransferase involved in cell wall biosynthesis